MQGGGYRAVRWGTGCDAGKARAATHSAAKHASRSGHCSNRTGISALLKSSYFLSKGFLGGDSENFVAVCTLLLSVPITIL